MPLKPGADRATIRHNIEKELDAGKDQKQAIAIALENARRTARPGQNPPKRKGK